jgi:hypothetical protein
MPLCGATACWFLCEAPKDITPSEMFWASHVTDSILGVKPEGEN